MLCSPLLRFDHFCSDLLFCSFCFFFLLFLARVHRGQYMHVCGATGRPSNPNPNPIWSVTVMYRPRYPCQSISPPHTLLSKLCPARSFVSLFALFCVWCVSMHAPASIRTHPHPPESLITPLCLCAHTYVFSGKFPGHGCIHQNHTLHTHSVLFPLVCSYVLVLLHPTAPIYTHMHPCAPVHTRPHPSAPQICSTICVFLFLM